MLATATLTPMLPARSRLRFCLAALLLALLALTGCASLPRLDSEARDAHTTQAIPLSAATTLGRIGGFSAGGGATTKRRLLEIENARLGAGPDLFGAASPRAPSMANPTFDGRDRAAAISVERRRA